MTLSTSAVAVCCCNDSRSSFSNRAFSIAITAWLGLVGKGGKQLYLLVGERAHQTPRQYQHADRRSFPHERRGNQGVKFADLGTSQLVVRIGPGIGNVNRGAFKQRTTACTPTPRFDGSAVHVFLEGGRNAVGRLMSKGTVPCRTGDISHIGFA